MKRDKKKLRIELETQDLSKVCSEAGTVNNEVRKLVEHYKHSCIGDIEEMKIEMLGMGGSDEDKEKKFKQAIKFVVNDKN